MSGGAGFPQVIHSREGYITAFLSYPIPGSDVILFSGWFLAYSPTERTTKVLSFVLSVEFNFWKLNKHTLPQNASYNRNETPKKERLSSSNHPSFGGFGCYFQGGVFVIRSSSPKLGEKLMHGWRCIADLTSHIQLNFGPFKLGRSQLHVVASETGPFEKMCLVSCWRLVICQLVS